MNISVTDRQGTGIMKEFARAIGATIKGRYFHIPKSKGGGFITGFTWKSGLRMILRNYYLHEEIVLQRTNEMAEGQDDIIFFIGGVLPPPLQQEIKLATEQPTVSICTHAVSSIASMPSDTSFRSITIAVPRQYLQKTFGNIVHPVVASILAAKEHFAYETSISPEMIKAASEILHPAVPETLENHYCKLKCEELLSYVFALLMQRDAVPTSNMHIDDIKAIYAVKQQLQSALDEPPNIAALAKAAGMSAPKMRKLFKQTFGKGVFEYYQSMRMQEAARLLKEKHRSVSEVGYQLGFTNLSHFSRVFEQHVGMKPKRYSVE